MTYKFSHRFAALLLALPFSAAQAQIPGTELGNSIDGLIDFNNPQPLLTFDEPLTYDSIDCHIPQVNKGTYISLRNRGSQYNVILNDEGSKVFSEWKDAVYFLMSRAKAELHCKESKQQINSPSDLPKNFSTSVVTGDNHRPFQSERFQLEALSSQRQTYVFKNGGYFQSTTPDELTEASEFLSNFEYYVSRLRPNNGASSWIVPLYFNDKSQSPNKTRIDNFLVFRSMLLNTTREPDPNIGLSKLATGSLHLSPLTLMGMEFSPQNPGEVIRLRFSETFDFIRKPPEYYEVPEYFKSGVRLVPTAEGERFLGRLNAWINSRLPLSFGEFARSRSVAQVLRHSAELEELSRIWWKDIIAPIFAASAESHYLRGASEELMKVGLFFDNAKNEQERIRSNWRTDEEFSFYVALKSRFGQSVDEIELANLRKTNGESFAVPGMTLASWRQDSENLSGIKAAVNNGMRILNRVWPGEPERLSQEGCDVIPGVARAIGEYKTLYFDPITKVAMDADYSRSGYVARVLETLDDINKASYKGETAREFLNRTLPEWEKLCGGAQKDAIEAELKRFE